MTVKFDTSVLADYYNARAGVNAAATKATAKTTSATPTAPWASSSTPSVSDLAKKVLAGARFIDPSAAKLDAPTAANASDYRDLFALHQGLSALEGLAAQQAAHPTAAVAARFAQGIKELSAFLATAPFDKLAVAEGQANAGVQASVGARTTADPYVGATVAEGSVTQDVPQFAGTVAFDLTVTPTGKAAKLLHFDLAELNGAPRTLNTVVGYLNGKLSAAGLSTRFAISTTAGTADTIKGADGKTITLAPAVNSYALKIAGDPGEALNFAAADAAPAVYATGGDARSVTLAKLDGVDPQGGEITDRALASSVSAVRAQAVGADGSVYLLADVGGTTEDGQLIKGSQDVALIKLDAAGKTVFTRTLGAASTASGYALAVGADGRVAVAGSVTGALQSGDAGADAAVSDSFVTVFDAKGVEAWTQRRGSAGADHATGVAFGADGSVYVTGVAQGAIGKGGGAVGGDDGYLIGFSKTGVQAFASQFGTTSADKPAGIVVTAGGVVVASTERGHAVLRRFELPASGTAAPSVTRDLGDLGGGSVAGLGVGPDGRLVIGGTTRSGSLAAGAATGAFPGGRALFVATLDAHLTAGGADRLSFADPGDNATASAFALGADGTLYLGGGVDAKDATGAATTAGYALGLNPTTGQVTWNGEVDGPPTALAVDALGSSSLDALGLPRGTPGAATATDVVSATSLRAGDQFTVQSGSTPAKTVTVDAGDTLADLAAKVNRASGFHAVASVVTVSGLQRLKILPADASSNVTLGAGPAGRDALGSLGFLEGIVSKGVGASVSSGAVATYGLGLSSALAIGDANAAKAAQGALQQAIDKVKQAYANLSTPKAKTTKSTATSASLSAYQSAQLANMRQALARLTA